MNRSAVEVIRRVGRRTVDEPDDRGRESLGGKWKVNKRGKNSERKKQEED